MARSNWLSSKRLGRVAGVGMVLFTGRDVLAQSQAGPRRDVTTAAAHRVRAERPLPVLRQPEVDSGGGGCPRGARLLRFPLLSTVGLAAPVAGIAALVSDHPMRAATGAMVGGAGYATGVTLWLATRRECHAGQALAYAATPIPAIVGAWAASR